MQRPAWIDDELYPFADRWEPLAGGCVHYVDEGAGRPLLMVHGNPTWSFLWRHVVLALRGEFRCIAVDLPGFGLSQAPPGYGFRPSEHARVLAGLIERLDLRDYVLMGQDWGGPVGLAAAGRAPARVAGLVLGNTWAWAMGPRRRSAYAWSLALGGIPGRWVISQTGAPVRVAMALGMRRVLSARELAHYEQPFSGRSREPVWRFAREVTGSGTWLEREALGALRVLRDRPALLPWGDGDALFPASERDRLAAELARARVVDLRGARHFIQEDAPGEIADAVRAWAAEELGAGAPVP
jgi:haloalkane dehalogenase